jgi:hypothetical protein
MSNRQAVILMSDAILTCGHCSAAFIGTRRQQDRVKETGRSSYCSEVCRFAFLRSKFSTPVPTRGPCLTCSKPFQSRREAKFCGMKCYTGSRQFTELLADARTAPRACGRPKQGQATPCLECGAEVYAKPSEKTKKYCSRACYRAYMAKRFDRHIANPEALALPQGYDGFLDRNELPCLVEGCGWSGRHLSLHMNYTHGIKAEEIKRAAGFNKGTGLIAKPLAQVLQGRDKVGVAADERMRLLGSQFLPSAGRVVAYRSLESAEHRAKVRALKCAAGAGPTRMCVGCGCSFQQSTPFGRAKHCTRECRAQRYAKLDAARRRPRQKGNSTGTDSCPTDKP